MESWLHGVTGELRFLVTTALSKDKFIRSKCIGNIRCLSGLLLASLKKRMQENDSINRLKGDYEYSDRSSSPTSVIGEKIYPPKKTTAQQPSSKINYNDRLEISIPTPISILKEICSKNGLKPEYKLLDIEGSEHKPTFWFAVTVDDITVQGSGQSKKKARDAAAKEAIRKMLLSSNNLNLSGINFGELNNTSASNIVATKNKANAYDKELALVECSYELANDEVNPVSKLHELCTKMKVDPPKFDIHNEEGPSHAKLFWFSCRVAEFDITTMSEGCSKKLAKRRAAEKMLTRLTNFVSIRNNSLQRNKN